MEKIRIGGLKLSDEHALVSLPERLASVTQVPAVLHGLVQHQVNLSFFCADYGAPPRVDFCLEPDDVAVCRVALDELFSPLGQQFEVTGAVGTLIIFPHQRRLAVLGRLLAVFGHHRLPFYSLCSSLSGLAVNTDLAALDCAAAALQEVFALPDNHAPFRPQLQSCPADGSLATAFPTPVETVASYWEPLIRIYGVSRHLGLSMTALVFSEAELATWGNVLQEVAGGQGSFDMAIMQRLDDQHFRLLIFDRGALAGVPSGRSSAIVDRRSADLLCLHGPHFQDRYGVAHAAVSCLQKQGVNALAIGCTGSSIYLAIPAQTADVAVRALTEVFIVPKV